jgi:hypothetical protein
MCRATYLKMKRELRQRGLDERAIRNTCEALSELKEGRWFLHPKAYDPTGLALGCPLPDRRYTTLLTRLAGLIDAWVTRRTGSEQPGISYVPPGRYHITVVNRSHYRFTEVTYLDAQEYGRIKAFVSRLGLGAIEVIACGMLLTSTGALLVKCVPADERLLALRCSLSEEFPMLRTNVPPAAHIKIGHLRTCLAEDELVALEAWLKHLEEHVTRRIVFPDVHTPQGRVPL